MVVGYDRDAKVYQCKVTGCSHAETRMSRGTRKKQTRRRKK